jgi:hypothetical protein
MRDLVWDACIGAAAMAAAILGFFTVTGLRLADLSGLWGSKDIISAYGQAKWLAAQPWSNTYVNLGYPWGQDWSHFPALDPVTRMEITALTTVLEPVLAVNVLYLISFPATAGMMYVALRLLSASRLLSFAGAVSLALLGVHFDSENPYLYNYWLVPAGLIWLASIAGTPSWMQRAQRPRTALAVGLVTGALVGLQNPQMATFFIILGAVAFAFHWRPTLTRQALRARLLVFAVAPAFFVASVVIGRLSRTIPATFDSSARTVEDSYVWGGKLVSLFGISGDSWLSANPVNQRLTEALTTTTWTGAAAEQNAAVVAATVLMLCAGLWAIMAPRIDSAPGRTGFDPARLWIGTWYAGLLFFVMTGLGVAFAALVTPQVRGWYRLSVPLAALALAGAAVLVTLLHQRLRSGGPDRRRAWVSLALTAVISVLVLDSFTQSYPIASDSRTRESLSNLVRAGERELGEDCAILSIPLVDFPEAFPRGRMEAYDHLLPFLESPSWKFSYGAIKGQLGSRWSDHLAVDPALQAAQAKGLGFCGILVDEQGLDDSLPTIGQYAEALGPAIATASGRWHLFSLRDVAPDVSATEFLDRPEVRYEDGFTPPVADDDAIVTRWTTGDAATVSVWNPASDPQALVMELPLTAADCRPGQQVDLTVDGSSRAAETLSPGESTTVRLPLSVPARGSSVVTLRTPSVGCPFEGQSVPVGVQIEDATFVSTGEQAVGFFWNSGFLPPEYDLSGKPLSWTTGASTATADVVSTDPTATAATVDLELLAPPCGSPRNVTVAADGHELADVPLTPGATTPVRLEVPLPPAGSVDLQFTDSGPGCIPPGDSRQLGAGVRLVAVS